MAQPSDFRPAGGRLSLLDSPKVAIAASFVILLVLQLELVFQKSINWDEFFHLSQIHASRRGEYVQWLQTPHVFLFKWLPDVVADPIDQVILARLLLVPFGLITAVSIWLAARHFAGSLSAALAAIAWFGAGYVFLHSFALRADIIAAMLLTLSICALVIARQAWLGLAVAALFVPLAFIATVKSVLYAPALAAVFVWRFKLHTRWLWLAVIGFGGLLSIILIIALVPGPAIIDVTHVLTASARRMFSAGLFPNGGYLLVQLAMAPAFTAMIILAFIQLRKPAANHPLWLAIGLAAPLLWVIIYRNAYPYFYTFILPPVAIAAAWGATPLIKRYSVGGVLVIVVLGAGILSLAEDRSMSAKQRVVHSGISEIFPEPVRYIDDNGFRPDFPRAIPHFASGWALENYRANGDAMYRDAMGSPPAPMLIRHGYALEFLDAEADDKMALLPSDAKALRENYIQHWGRIFVAGKNFAPSGQKRLERIIIPGLYTVEKSPVTINGTAYRPGKVVRLERGTITLGPIGEGGASLRWGDNLSVPDEPFPDGWLFTNY